MPNLFCMECGAKTHYSAIKPKTCPKCSHGFDDIEIQAEEKPTTGIRPKKKPVVKKVIADDSTQKINEPQDAKAPEDQITLEDLKEAFSAEDASVQVESARKLGALRDNVDAQKPRKISTRVSKEQAQAKYEKLREAAKNREGSTEIGG